MRRWILVLVVAVAAAFAAVAIPGSPVTSWMVDLLAGGQWHGISGDAAPITKNASSPQPLLRVAVGAMVTPERTYSDYQELFALVAEQAGRRLQLVQRKTYRELNDLIDAGKVDLAWVCTGALRDLDRRKAARLVAVPVIAGRSDYRSYIIVPESAPASSFDELRKMVFAFTDPLSLTGRQVVVDLVTTRGETIDDFFAETFFTHAHDNSIRAVRDGLAAGACVDSLVYDYLAELDPEETAGTRVLWRSGRYPIPPLVSPTSVDPGLFEELRRILLDLHHDPDATVFLEHLRVDSFVGGDSRLYFSE